MNIIETKLGIHSIPKSLLAFNIIKKSLIVHANKEEHNEATIILSVDWRVYIPIIIEAPTPNVKIATIARNNMELAIVDISPLLIA